MLDPTTGLRSCGLLLVFLLGACGGEYGGEPVGSEGGSGGTGGSNSGTGGMSGAGGGGGSAGLEPKIESIQTHVFTPRCTSCHAGGNPSGGLRLDNAQTSHSNLVNRPAQQNPFVQRVAPGDPDNSYLIDKLEGTGLFSRMPQGSAPLPTATINVIRQWIDDGALPPGRSLFMPAVDETAP